MVKAKKRTIKKKTLKKGMTKSLRWYDVSPIEGRLNEALLAHSSGKVKKLLKKLLKDKDMHLMQAYANNVSIRRLGFNDHGPVHMKIVAHNAIKILELLHDAGVKTSLEEESVGTYEDSQVAVMLGALLHDVGMGVTRDKHEWHSLHQSDSLIQKYLEYLYPSDAPKRIALRMLVHECIVGHMANDRIYSVEAGTLLVADGTDMAKGRSRILEHMEKDSAIGDIHQYSASAIVRVNITKGRRKPVLIEVFMDNLAGTFQVEEVFMAKVKASPIMNYLEISAVNGTKKMTYLH